MHSTPKVGDVFSISFDIDASFQNEPFSHSQNRSIAYSVFSRMVRHEVLNQHVIHLSVMIIVVQVVPLVFSFELVQAKEKAVLGPRGRKRQCNTFLSKSLCLYRGNYHGQNPYVLIWENIGKHMVDNRLKTWSNIVKHGKQSSNTW
jgi:hypothetical protein